MRTNIFRVRKKTENKIVIEEEKTKNPFLLFLKRHRKFILFVIFSLIICLLLVSVGIAFSVFQTSSDFDISYLNDTSDEIITNNDPSITDDDIKEDLLGEVARRQGVILLVETFMTDNNDVVYYFSDGTAIIVMSDGKIYRVSSLDDGRYGVLRNGSISDKAKKVLVKANTTTLNDGTVITYYSDGSARVDHNNITIFVRDSNNIKLDAGTKFSNVAPSGVAINDKLVRDGNNSMYVYTSNAKYVIDNGTRYLVNPRAKATAENDNISYDKNNSFKVLETKKLSDGNTVYYFDNGSAVIVSDEDNNNTVYVKKSGDIVIKKDKIYEIITNDYGYSKGVINCSDGKKVTYFDNGAAIITDTNGNNIYVEDSDEILYDGNKNVIGTPSHSKETSKKTTTDGYDVVNFNNGKSQVIKDDGTSFIIDTDKLIFDSDGAITSDDNKDDEKDNEDKPQEPDDTDDEEEREDPLEGMYVSEAEHSYEDDRTKNNQYSNFIIRNDNTRTKRFRIVIEEVDNYSKYNASRLAPNYVKFQATVGDSFVGPNMLDNNTWTDENGKVNYVIYDGSIRAKSSLEVSVNLYVDYALLSNREQDKTFIGTIKVYVNE